mgnify:CR=1 FL=1
MTVVCLSGLQIWVGIFPAFYLLYNLCRAVRILLAFEAHTDMLRIFYTMLAGNASALEVAGVHLKTRFIGIYLKEDASRR